MPVLLYQYYTILSVLQFEENLASSLESSVFTKTRDAAVVRGQATIG